MRRFPRLCVVGAAVAVAVTVAVACGGGGGSPTAPSDGGGAGGTGGGTPAAATITIGSDGRVAPASITVTPGSRVTFVNNHNRPHDMSSDPHPDHTDCPEINQVGFLQAGQTRTTGNLNTVRVCGFHDHNEPTNSALAGSITIR
ncbi:MAG: hypothetical protein ABI880_06450 [Acidobacteriota bacterium]